MRIYLDVCCLKRPFDRQSQPRIEIETTAVLAILRAWTEGTIELLRTVGHGIENDQNRNALRAAIVRGFLAQLPDAGPTPAIVRRRTPELAGRGIGAFDAFHLAWAEHLRADCFLTTDNRLITAASGVIGPPLRVMNPVQWVEEFSP